MTRPGAFTLAFLLALSVSTTGGANGPIEGWKQAHLINGRLNHKPNLLQYVACTIEQGRTCQKVSDTCASACKNLLLRAYSECMDVCSCNYYHCKTACGTMRQCPNLAGSSPRGLRQARSGTPSTPGICYLEMKCPGCDTHQTVALDIVRRPKTTPIHELERYMRCKDCSDMRGHPYKRSHLVALRPTKISASDPPPHWWPGER